jgi:hypothetical protein
MAYGFQRLTPPYITNHRQMDPIIIIMELGTVVFESTRGREGGMGIMGTMGNMGQNGKKKGEKETKKEKK